MDDIAHQCPRKRKQDQDDCQEPAAAADPVPERDKSSSAGPRPSRNPPNTPRQPWLAEADDNWTSPTSPQVSSPLTTQVVTSSKRPRLDTLSLDTKRPVRSATRKILPPARQGSDIEDIGIVSTADPGPSSGSLLRGGGSSSSSSSGAHRPYETYLKPRDPPEVVYCDQDSEASSSIIDITSPHIPPCRPLINRSTLKELELDIILRNPVIRHDLLFDPGLQFRPRRKRERFERYWNAVWEELQTGCTCVTVDIQAGTLHPKICVCARYAGVPLPPSQFSAEQSIPGVDHLYTVRQPSRIPPLLEEFLEVMVFVIQPLSNTAVYTDPTAIREQAQEHSAHAAHLRAIFDPEFIAQELRHGVFDPAGLFRQIGDTLKHHCAPMRDSAVEEMVQIAQRPGLEAFKAVRTCLELLELMKLDIANHQLTQLRPWLLRNTGIFEVKAFKIRFGANASLHNTVRWLHGAHHALLERTRPISHAAFVSPLCPAGALRYADMRRNQQIYLAVLKGIVDLIFDAQELYPSSSSNGNTPPFSPVSPMDGSPSPSPSSTPTSPVNSNARSLPETLYLDKARIPPLGQEAASASALYMFMLLFRQLVLSPSESHASHPQVSAVQMQSDMVRLKREIRDIGPACLGVCFEPAPSSTDAEAPYVPSSSREVEQLREVKEGIVLQIAKRACDTSRRAARPSLHLSTSTATVVVAASQSQPEREWEFDVGDAPDQGVLRVARRWADANMQAGSPLAALVHRRMRDAVFDAVVCLAYPSSSSPTAPGAGPIPSTSTSASPTHPPLLSTPGKPVGLGIDLASSAPGQLSAPAAQLVGGVAQAAGMEAVADEIRRLAEDAARLALIHINTHLPLYEGQGFFPASAGGGSTSLLN